MFAVNEGHKDIVQILVSAEADILIKDKVCAVMECSKYSKREKKTFKMLKIT